MKRRAKRAVHLQMMTVLLSGLLINGCGEPDKKDAVPAQTDLTVSETAPTIPATTGVKLVDALANTQWRLVEIQSMDDAVGTKHPNDSSPYTMRLNGDGSVAMRLNCNSANGTWSAEASADAVSGHFEFGPLVATRALCPPSSLDEDVSTQAQYIRSYLLKDGKLYLSLMADGGIYVWEPFVDAAFKTTPDPALETAILAVSPDYTREVVEQEGGVGKAHYVYGRVDLNGDGQDEVFVYPLGSIFCGSGGCNMMLFTPAADGYMLVNELSISRLPVIVTAQINHGWKDFWQLQSGGGAPATYVRYQFDGKQYAEQERVPGDKEPDGSRYLTGELNFDKGIPLEPRD